MTLWAHPGDIILYEKPRDVLEELIEDGERMEDGTHKRWFYHVAIALGPYDMLEAISRVSISPLDYHNCVICRPPYDRTKIHAALRWGKKREGRLYGYIGVVDQALRDLTHDRLHMPKSFIEWMNSRWPYCSVLTSAIARKAGFKQIRQWPPPDPEAVWEAVKNYVVYDWRAE